MKTTTLSLVTLCGMLANFSPLTAQTPDAQPAKSPPAEAKTNTPKSNKDIHALRLSAGLDDVVELARAGVDETVILTFIQSSPVAYHPSAQEVIKLRELGVSTPVITAVLHRGAEVQRRTVQALKESQAAAPAPATSFQPSTAATRAVQPATVYYAPPVITPTVVHATYPTSTYSSVASYGYGGCYYPRYSYYPRVRYYGGFYPRFSFGVRFGGHHYGGFRGGFGYCR